jgi:[lysine-biosynthesis-protein LysW]--L-2-aminoadipate ligase
VTGPRPGGPELAVLASRVRFEEKRIFAALERRGVAYVHVDTRRVAAGLGGDRSYTAVLNREISQSRGYYASLLFEAQGARTLNRSEVIAVCGDKLRTSLELERSGLPTPRTSLALTPEAAPDAMEELGFPVVVKPLTGSWGRLAALVRDQAEAEIVLEHRAALQNPQQHIIYLQEFIEKPDRDIRVLVVGDEAVGASYRYSDGWRTNAARNGRSVPCPLTAELTDLALRAAKAVGGGVLGVDLIEGPDRLYVLEVNHTVEFQGLQSAHGEDLDVAEAIVSHVLDPS